MSLRVFVDQCVPLSVVHRLGAAGHDAIRLRDVMPMRSPDPAVIAKAQELDCILLSLKGDFSDIVSYPPANYKGIIALQLHNHPEILDALVTRLIAYFAAHPDPAHYHAPLLLVEPHRIRIRT
jgi:predicted nuclease of predicted toxin-antitoxin system